jgi:hypothetical protein
MKTITVKQPWASLIVEGIKNIENRTWKTKFRGRILIHAGKNCAFDYLMPDGKIISDTTDKLGWHYDNIPHGSIIGSVEIVDCVINHESIWAEKNDPILLPEGMVFIKPIYNWVLENPIKFEHPIENVKGKLSLWEYDLKGIPSLK